MDHCAIKDVMSATNMLEGRKVYSHIQLEL